MRKPMKNSVVLVNRKIFYFTLIILFMALFFWNNNDWNNQDLLGAEQSTGTLTELYSEGHRVSSPKEIPSVWDDLLTGINTKEEWTKRREENKKKFLKLMADEAKPKKPPLDLKWLESVKVDGLYTRWLVSYNVESDERAHAYLAVPLNKKGPFPAVVTLHGTTPQGMEQSAGLSGDPDKAHLDYFARRGFVVIAPEHFVSGRRIPQNKPYDTSEFYKKHPNWTAVGKFTYEHSIAIDVLEQVPQVDKTKIGAMGHSLGGQGTIFLAAYDDRIKAAASNCCAHTFRQTETPEHWSRGSWYVYFQTMRKPLLDGKRLPDIDQHEIMALIAPRPYLDVCALNDGNKNTQAQRVLMLMKVMQVYDLLDTPENFAFYVHGRNHSIKEESQTLIYTWLKVHLAKPEPDANKPPK